MLDRNTRDELLLHVTRHKYCGARCRRPIQAEGRGKRLPARDRLLPDMASGIGSQLAHLHDKVQIWMQGRKGIRNCRGLCVYLDRRDADVSS